MCNNARAVPLRSSRLYVCLPVCVCDVDKQRAAYPCITCYCLDMLACLYVAAPVPLCCAICVVSVSPPYEYATRIYLCVCRDFLSNIRV